MLTRTIRAVAAAAVLVVPLSVANLVGGGAAARGPEAIGSGGILEISVAGTNGVPSNASAVSLHVTVSEPAGAGYLTVFPCGTAVPNASNLNYSRGETRSNAVITRVGNGGKVCVYSFARAEVIVDLNGYFGANSAFSSMGPTRVTDTRVTRQRLAKGSVTPIKLAGVQGVPNNATAALLNVTAVDPTAPGYLTVYPCDVPQPTASNVNFVTGQTVPNLVIASLAGDGTTCIFASVTTDVIVDASGWSSQSSAYSKIAPKRVTDTRFGLGGGRLGAGQTAIVDPAVGSSVEAVALNVTATNSAGPGYLTVYPCGAGQPGSSNVNTASGQAVGNLVVSRIGGNGRVCVYSSVTTDLVVDVNGFIGTSAGYASLVPVRLVDTRTTFPTAASAGVPAGTSLRAWTGSLSTSDASGLPTEARNGMQCKVFEGWSFSMSGGQSLSVNSPCVIIRRSSFTTSGSTHALVLGSRGNSYLEIVQSNFDGGPNNVRGVQSDVSDVYISNSEFTRFGEAGVEMNDRSGTKNLTVEDSYFYQPKGWPSGQHVDGIQMAAGGSITIRHNTVLVEPYGGSTSNSSYVSNSAIGIGTALGNIGNVVIDRNLLAGGGRLIYVQDKDYSFTGTVTVTNNVFDRRFTNVGAIWGPIYPSDLPARLVWSGNMWDNGQGVNLQQALAVSP